MQLTEQQIEIIRQYLSTQPVLKAYVFGSYARGDADENSDIDLLVQIDYDHMTGGIWFFGLEDELKNKLNKPVDVVSEKAVSPYIEKFVNREKQLIYERAIS